MSRARRPPAVYSPDGRTVATPAGRLVARLVGSGEFAAPPGLLSPSPLSITTTDAIYNYFAPGNGAQYCDEYVCLSVCLSTRITREPHGRYMLREAAVFSYRWVSGQNQARYDSPRGGTSRMFPC